MDGLDEVAGHGGFAEQSHRHNSRPSKILSVEEVTSLKG